MCKKGNPVNEVCRQVSEALEQFAVSSYAGCVVWDIFSLNWCCLCSWIWDWIILKWRILRIIKCTKCLRWTERLTQIGCLQLHGEELYRLIEGDCDEKLQSKTEQKILYFYREYASVNNIVMEGNSESHNLIGASHFYMQLHNMHKTRATYSTFTRLPKELNFFF